MTTQQRMIVSAATILLTGLSAHATAAQATAPLATLTARPGGFLTPSDRQAPQTHTGRRGGLEGVLCAVAKRSSGLNCPLHSGGASASGTITAGLPHLRLNIDLEEVRNVVVAGSGVADLSDIEFLYALTKMTTTTADASQPTAADPGYMVVIPPPGQVWSDFDEHGRLFAGVILNGCLGSAATFDLTLDATAYRWSHPESLGTIHLMDSVKGHGYYNFQYTLRATDTGGNISDITFSGDADSVCTAKSDLS